MVSTSMKQAEGIAQLVSQALGRHLRCPTDSKVKAEGAQQMTCKVRSKLDLPVPVAPTTMAPKRIPNVSCS